MASSDILSQTLSSITSIKLEELSIQRSNFEDGKAKLLIAVDEEPNQIEKVRLLVDGIESLPSINAARLGEKAPTSLNNIRRFLEQACYDPSVSVELQKGWQTSLQEALDRHSLRCEYASLYGRLVSEWLSVSENGADSTDEESPAFEEVGRSEMHEQRKTWEDYVFQPHETDAPAINTYLEELFNSNKNIQSAYAELTTSTSEFQKRMATDDHFNKDTLTQVIQGLLQEDLVTDEKRTVLNDFLNNKVVLGEVADVLNMRMESLDKWKWDPRGTPVEQRRKLNGRYRFYHDEDLLQSILLRYIGVRWSVHFKAVLSHFQSAVDVWKESSQPVPIPDMNRRRYMLGNDDRVIKSVESERAWHFRNSIFLEQLQKKISEPPRRYDESDSDSDDDSDNNGDAPASSTDLTQSVLHILATEIIMKTRLGEEISVVRSDFRWFGPSLPHSTMFAVLKFFNVSENWIDFFRRALEAPMKFVQDGPDAPVRIRKRGTPISGPLSNMLGETVLFCLDFALNQKSDGAYLYRLHDDIWFWGDEKTCVKGWRVMTEFADLMGLEFAEEKTGSVKITRTGDKPNEVAAGLPKGDVRWGFLKLDSVSGRFVIDQDNVDRQIEELALQLRACRSVFEWVHVWNVFGVRFFTTNFGRPANCFGRAHVEMILQAFARIQNRLFASTGGSVTSTLKQMITDRFGVKDIPEGFLYFPMTKGGLDLKNPFIGLNLIHDTVAKDPDIFMDSFFTQEEEAYRKAKEDFDNDRVPGRPATLPKNLEAEPFMTFEEYTRYREQTSETLSNTYTALNDEPRVKDIVRTADVSSPYSEWDLIKNPYQQWILQLYAPDMMARFGERNVVDKGMLPTGMVSAFRESRYKWQG